VVTWSPGGRGHFPASAFAGLQSGPGFQCRLRHVPGRASRCPASGRAGASLLSSKWSSPLPLRRDVACLPPLGPASRLAFTNPSAFLGSPRLPHQRSLSWASRGVTVELSARVLSWSSPRPSLISDLHCCSYGISDLHKLPYATLVDVCRSSSSKGVFLSRIRRWYRYRTDLRRAQHFLRTDPHVGIVLPTVRDLDGTRRVVLPQSPCACADP
jgi:hypothetical protein